MATSRKPLRNVAVDTGALLALASTRDQYHERALASADHLKSDGARLTGHALVLGELHGHLLRRTDIGTARRVTSSCLHRAGRAVVEPEVVSAQGFERQ